MIEGLEGVTAMDCRVTGVDLTVRVSLVLTLPSVAVICEVPAVMPVASPVFVPIVATAVLEELQFTLAVMFLVLLSL